MTTTTYSWRPASAYSIEMGRVLVWLSWSAYSRPKGGIFAAGEWIPAYQVGITDAPNLWVQAYTCEPLETTGRKVTHFTQPSEPR